jgi:hypothetical protein
MATIEASGGLAVHLGIGGCLEGKLAKCLVLSTIVANRAYVVRKSSF